MTPTEAMAAHDECIKAVGGLLHKAGIDLEHLEIGDHRGVRAPNRVTRLFLYREPIYDIVTAREDDGEMQVRTYAVTRAES